MIELDSKTQHDFLNREWVQKLLDAGVDMSDAKYYICQPHFCGMSDPVQVALKKELPIIEGSSNAIPAAQFRWCLPTYTVSELLYKLHEWIYPTIDGKEYSGGLQFFKDAPFYVFYYGLKHKEGDTVTLTNDSYICAQFETPIESLAAVLIQCHKKGTGLGVNDTGNVQKKYETHKPVIV